MADKLNFKKTKETMDRILDQARDSVKVLEALQKEGLARAKAAMPTKEFTNEKLVATLKKMGIATRAEVRDLEKKVEDLASELRAQISKVSRKTSAKKSDKDDSQEANY